MKTDGTARQPAKSDGAAPSGADQDARARRYAAALLGQRAYSRKKLIDRMTRKGFDDAVAQRVAERFVSAGVLDDAALAAVMVRAEIARKPAGPFLLEMKLVAKGIDRATARDAANEALADRDLAADALALATKRLAAISPSLEDATRRRRVYASLARRGFSPDICRVAVERAMGPMGKTTGEMWAETEV
ncbi:MAG: regulatory protein RecX [Planctomycetes bacterium]|nr:regulatory protein RecX [Planctomycetota bacterium]